MSNPNTSDMLSAIRAANSVLVNAQQTDGALRAILRSLICETGDATVDKHLGAGQAVGSFITLAAAGVLAAFTPGPNRTEALQALVLAKEAVERAARSQRH